MALGESISLRWNYPGQVQWVGGAIHPHISARIRAPQCREHCTTASGCAVAQYTRMEWRDARWVIYIAAAVLWAALLGVCAGALPAGAGGGSLVQAKADISDRIARPPLPSATEQVHIYTGDSQAARVFWEQPAAGRVHITIELPAGQGGGAGQGSPSAGSTEPEPGAGSDSEPQPE
jgi:hypothetical protein